MTTLWLVAQEVVSYKVVPVAIIHKIFETNSSFHVK